MANTAGPAETSESYLPRTETPLFSDTESVSEEAQRTPAEIPIPGKRGWPDAIVAALLIGFVLAIPLNYFVLDFPELSMWATLWDSTLLASLALFTFMLWRKPALLGTTQEQSRRVILLLIPVFVGIFLPLLTTLFTGYFGFRYWAGVAQSIFWLVSDVIFLAIFLRVWRRPPGNFRRKIGEKRFSALMNAVTPALFLLSSLSFVLLPDISARPFKIARPAAGWERQYNLALNAARELDKGAVLSMVSADPYYPVQHDFNLALLVRWFFDTPSGKDIDVAMRDTDPEATVKAEWNGGTNFLPTTASGMASEAKAWATNNLSTRDVFDKAKQDAAQRIASKGGNYRLNIRGTPDNSAIQDTPDRGGYINWKISFITDGNPYASIYTYNVNGQSGTLSGPLDDR